MIKANDNCDYSSIKRITIRNMSTKISDYSAIYNITVDDKLEENLPFIFEMIFLELAKKNREDSTFTVLDGLVSRLFQYAVMYRKNEVTLLTLIDFIDKLNILNKSSLIELRETLIGETVKTSSCKK